MRKYRQYKKKYAKKSFKTGVRGRKKYGRGVVKRTGDGAVHYFKRVQYLTTNYTISADAFIPNTFSLNLLSNVTEYSSLFKWYMITGVKLTYEFDVDVNTVVNATSTVIRNTRPIVHSIIDRYDVSAVTIDKMQQNSTYKKVRAGYEYSRYIPVNVLMPAYSSLTTTGYEPKFKQWVDMDDTDVQHYGLKSIIEIGNNLAVTYKTLMTFYFKCKGTR
nr:MAG: capsid protein [Cressdnaviricota sp.]